MERHLLECAPAHDSPGKRQGILQLRFGTEADARYWLYVETRSDGTLEDVDALLRRVWLECCGHMSAFRVGRKELGKRSKVGSALGSSGFRFDYEYDFGSTTLLHGEVLGTREGSPGRHVVRLLARNEPLPWTCTECAASATLVCPFCIYEGDAFYCKTHAATHSHAEEEVYLPVVNSPRMGVCGYTG